MLQRTRYSRIFWYGTIIAVIFLGEVLFYNLYLISKLSPILNPFQEVINVLKIFWLVSLPYVVFNLLGLLLFGPPQLPQPDLNNPSTKKITLRISYCTKGKNFLALRRSLKSVQKAIKAFQLFQKQQANIPENQNILTGIGKFQPQKLFKNIEVEVITDTKLPQETFPKRLNVREIVVPGKYQTQNKTLYKARALHYAIQKQQANENLYILRLDEESAINYQTLLGIVEFLQNKSEQQVIGQGEILYNSHQYGGKISITVADAMRSGDDLGRFRLQYKFKKSYFGMHGSYVLIRSDVEKKIGYDHGPRASITEDAYLALKIASLGYQFGWINGCIYEQSPFTYHEFIQQRKRWFQGISNVVKDKNIPFKDRSFLLFCRYMWAFSWLSFVVTILNILCPSETNPVIALIGGFIFSAYVLIYFIGTLENLQNISFAKKTKFYLYLLSIFFIPISSILEGLGVVSGIFIPVKQFDIVSKN